MSIVNPSRVPAGIPSGGQFAHKSGSESSGGLPTATRAVPDPGAADPADCAGHNCDHVWLGDGVDGSTYSSGQGLAYAFRNANIAASRGYFAVVVEENTFDEEEICDGELGPTDSQSELRLFVSEEELQEFVEGQGLVFEDRADIARQEDGSSVVSFENTMRRAITAYVSRPNDERA